MPIPFSYELFPPRSASVAARMPEIARTLGETHPDFISVTFGAGGSSRDASLDVLQLIRDETTARPLAHLTCVGSSMDEASELIGEFLDHGILDFLALRGDPPAGLSETDDFLGDLRTGAELAQLIEGVRQQHLPRELGPIAGRWHVRTPQLGVTAVAAYPNGHPQSRSIGQDYDTLLAKEAAGATLAITQLFFEVDDYVAFVEGARAHGVTMPIRPGIMAITSLPRLERMSQLAGEEVPDRWRRSLAACRSDEARRELGIAHATGMCHDLIDYGEAGLHIYTHNRIDEPLELLRRVGLVDRPDAAPHTRRVTSAA
ncbi:methylenetetrahydrofolate reductase [Gulosibacter sp. ACHW.36C]|uniref:Methylenetetrahydrofolate reductase n=1 Tax=Gulosibacter sediminis TaxID=1729695 RepID=A0ABY4MZ93_9MICO|nr:methylenetetrahydrofolate reductase [Gulosibacter sediminis]UQN15714.1 methylenetetrahydrofolate reductase [Gulosibacter sediminis]